MEGKVEGIRDNLYSLLAVGVMILTTCLFWVFMYSMPSWYDTDWKRYVITGIFSFINIGFIFFLVKVRGEKLESIGFTKKNLWKSSIIGILGSIAFAIIILLQTPRPIIFVGVEGKLLTIIFKFIKFLIFIGLTEELVFRAYSGSRFFIKNKMISAIIIGTLFSFLHIPGRMINNDLGLLEVLFSDWGNLILLMLYHCMFQWLYSKYKNIAGPVILHLAMNFLSWCIPYLTTI